MRAKFQVLVLPFAVTEDDVRYCVFKRPDMNFWQFVLGGGEDMETPFEAAVRKCRDEIGAENGNFYKLDRLPLYRLTGSEKESAPHGDRTA